MAGSPLVRMAVDVLTALRALPGGPGCSTRSGSTRRVDRRRRRARRCSAARARDIDLVVEGDAAPLAAHARAWSRLHERFGTVAAIVAGEPVDIAMARTERYAAPGRAARRRARRPRRGFACAATSPSTRWRSTCAARCTRAPDAVEDLDAGRLRVLHERSFLDDPTRLWRLARYAARLGFGVEPETERLAREAVAAGALRTVSGPGSATSSARAQRDRSARALAAAHDLGLLPPGLVPRRGSCATRWPCCPTTAIRASWRSPRWRGDRRDAPARLARPWRSRHAIATSSFLRGGRRALAASSPRRGPRRSPRRAPAARRAGRAGRRARPARRGARR